MTLEIRLATSDDASEIADIYRPIVVGTPISFEVEPPDRPEAARRIHPAAGPFKGALTEDGIPCSTTPAAT